MTVTTKGLAWKRNEMWCKSPNARELSQRHLMAVWSLFPALLWSSFRQNRQSNLKRGNTLTRKTMLDKENLPFPAVHVRGSKTTSAIHEQIISFVSGTCWIALWLLWVSKKDVQLMLKKLLALHNRMVFKVPYPQYYVLLNVKYC